jgi:hypothetical protein
MRRLASGKMSLLGALALNVRADLHQEISGSNAAVNFTGTQLQRFSWVSGSTITGPVDFGVSNGASLDVGSAIIDGDEGCAAMRAATCVRGIPMALRANVTARLYCTMPYSDVQATTVGQQALRIAGLSGGQWQKCGQAALPNAAMRYLDAGQALTMTTGAPASITFGTLSPVNPLPVTLTKLGCKTVGGDVRAAKLNNCPGTAPATRCRFQIMVGTMRYWIITMSAAPLPDPAITVTSTVMPSAWAQSCATTVSARLIPTAIYGIRRWWS